MGTVTNKTTMPAGLQASIPRYVCHKIVRALKIRRIDHNLSTPRYLAIGFEDNFEAFEGLMVFDTQNKPVPSPGWYYVLYDNGYESFSPPEAFEEGYTAIGDASAEKWDAIRQWLEGQILVSADQISIAALPKTDQDLIRQYLEIQLELVAAVADTLAQ